MHKVLVIEDEKETNDFICNFLRRSDIQVDSALTLAEAFEKVKSYPDVVLLDIMMDNKESFTLFEHINKYYPQIKVVIVSGYDNNENIKKAKELGASGFIPKPIATEHLRKFIQKTLNSLFKQNN